MISKDELMRLAGAQKINPSSLGKDYALGWLLFGISQSSAADKLVFKGGTALSKIYFPENWRLSEDLDFTITDEEIDFESIINALEKELPEIVQKENEMTVVLKKETARQRRLSTKQVPVRRPAWKRHDQNRDFKRGSSRQNQNQAGSTGL